MSSPIIFIHKGKNEFLRYAIKQAQFYNPNSDIYLLGDERNKNYHDNHFMTSDYFVGARHFSKQYKHLTSTPYDYELFCFQRWFVLREFIAKSNLGDNGFVYLDSDLLLFVDVNDYFGSINPKYNITYSAGGEKFRGYSPHVTYFATLEALDSFCGYITNMYNDDIKETIDYYELHFKNKDRFGGISDMNTLANFVNNNSETSYDLSIIRDGAVFDHNINCSDGFNVGFNGKYIMRKNQIPFGVLSDTNQPIKFNSLHCQGAAKFMIFFYCRKNTIKQFVHCYCFYLLGLCRSLLSRLKHYLYAKWIRHS